MRKEREKECEEAPYIYRGRMKLFLRVLEHIVRWMRYVNVEKS